MIVPGQKTWVEISRGAMEKNIASLRSFLLPNVEFCAVLKANAYGHDLRIVANICRDAGVSVFAVDSIDEAIIVRDVVPTCTIIVLGYTVPERIADVLRIDAVQVVSDPEHLIRLVDDARTRHIPARISIKIETGLHRQGVTMRALEHMLEIVRGAGEWIRFEGISSHFANAEDVGNPTNAQQIALFTHAIAMVHAYGFSPHYQHIACSAAALTIPESQGTTARFGITLYGLWPSKEVKRSVVLGRQNIELEPVLSWKTRIAQVKDVPPGGAIGYGGTHVANRPLRIAVLPVGYYDGYDRALSNCGEVLVKGRRCPVLGNVCMNMTMIDVSAVPSVAAGDDVTLLGRDGMHGISADDLAARIGTVNYEIVTRINPLLPRIPVA